MKTEEMLEALKKVNTPNITNVLATYPNKRDTCLCLYDPWEDNWYTDSTLRCMYPELGPQLGYAVTVTFGLPDEEHPDMSKMSELYQALADSPKPSVLIIKQDMPEKYKKKNGLAGGNMMSAFKSLGCVGVITDGPSRDIDEVREIGGIQYMMTGVCAGHGPFVIKEVNAPVSVCGMDVKAGEIVHMDENGACVFPADKLEAVCEKALLLDEAEALKQHLFQVNTDPKVMDQIRLGKHPEQIALQKEQKSRK